jgi:hypothetical protein
VFGGDLQISPPSWLLPLPYLHSDMSHCDDVMDLFLDQARSGSRQGHVGRDLPANAFHAAC